MSSVVSPAVVCCRLMSFGVDKRCAYWPSLNSKIRLIPSDRREASGFEGFSVHCRALRRKTLFQVLEILINTSSIAPNRPLISTEELAATLALRPHSIRKPYFQTAPYFSLPRV